MDTTAANSGALAPLYNVQRRESKHGQETNQVPQRQAGKVRRAGTGPVARELGCGARRDRGHGRAAARLLSTTSQKEAAMRDLNYDFKQLCRRNRDGSFATQADREHILDLIADQLHEMGVRGLRAQGFKPKHIELLVERWLAEELAPGTIKNRMSQLRWLAQKIGKDNIVARTNAAYGIPDRVYVTNISKGKELDMGKLKQIPDLFIHMSLCFQVLFGLRREESIKIVPAWADRGDRLVLKDSWTKGGREREIPIRTEEQRELIEQAKAIAKGKSLVAPHYKTYRD